MKIVGCLFILLLLIPSVSGAAQMGTHVILATDNGNFSFGSTQHYTDIIVKSDSVVLNGSNISFVSTSKVDATINQYDTSLHNYNIALSGSGNVNLTQKILSPNANVVYAGAPFAFLKDGGAYNNAVTNASQWLLNTLSLSSATYVWGFAYDWYNSKTQDDDLYIHPSQKESTTYMLLFGDMTSTAWSVDGTPVSESSNILTQAFATAGHKTIEAYGITPGGNTQTVTWNIIAERQKSGAGDEHAGMNTSWFDQLVNDVSNDSPDYLAILGTISLPFDSAVGPLFFLFIYALPLVVIWIRQENAIIPVILGIVFGAFFLTKLPEAWIGPAQLFIVLTTMGVVYSLYKQRS